MFFFKCVFYFFYIFSYFLSADQISWFDQFLEIAAKYNEKNPTKHEDIEDDDDTSDDNDES